MKELLPHKPISFLNPKLRLLLALYMGNPCILVGRPAGEMKKSCQSIFSYFSCVQFPERENFKTFL